MTRYRNRPLPTLALLLAASSISVLGACQRVAAEPTAAPAMSVTERAGSAFGPEISAEDFSAHVKILASDEFAGCQVHVRNGQPDCARAYILKTCLNPRGRSRRIGVRREYGVKLK